MSRISSRGTHMGFDALDIDTQLNRQKKYKKYQKKSRGKKEETRDFEKGKGIRAEKEKWFVRNKK